MAAPNHSSCLQSTEPGVPVCISVLRVVERDPVGVTVGVVQQPVTVSAHKPQPPQQPPDSGCRERVDRKTAKDWRI